MPVHPILAALLADWRQNGFMQLTGHAPTPDDLLVPSRIGRIRGVNRGWQHFAGDLMRLGFRHRRQHDTRRTFISLARAGGAQRDVLAEITHGQKSNVMDMYTTLPWETLCEAVLCLKIRLLSPEESEATREAVAATEEARLRGQLATAPDPSNDEQRIRPVTTLRVPPESTAPTSCDGSNDDSAVVAPVLSKATGPITTGNGAGWKGRLKGKGQRFVTGGVTRRKKADDKTLKGWEYHAKSVGVDLGEKVYMNTIRHR